jgi:hypothetical protein
MEMPDDARSFSACIIACLAGDRRATASIKLQSKNRELQSQVISLTEAMLSQARSSDGTALKASIDKYEDIRAAYNHSDDELQLLLMQLEDMARSH